MFDNHNTHTHTYKYTQLPPCTYVLIHVCTHTYTHTHSANTQSQSRAHMQLTFCNQCIQINTCSHTNICHSKTIYRKPGSTCKTCLNNIILICYLSTGITKIKFLHYSNYSCIAVCLLYSCIIIR